MFDPTPDYQLGKSGAGKAIRWISEEGTRKLDSGRAFTACSDNRAREEGDGFRVAGGEVRSYP